MPVPSKIQLVENPLHRLKQDWDLMMNCPNNGIGTSMLHTGCYTDGKMFYIATAERPELEVPYYSVRQWQSKSNIVGFRLWQHEKDQKGESVSPIAEHLDIPSALRLLNEWELRAKAGFKKSVTPLTGKGVHFQTLAIHNDMNLPER